MQLSRAKIEQHQDNAFDPLEVHELIFEQKLLLPLHQSEQEQAKVVPLIFKVVRVKNIQKLIVYILSEADLYFLYKIQLDFEAILQLNNQYKLSLKRLTDFVQFLKMSLDDIQQQQKTGQVQLFSDYTKKILVFTLRKTVGGKSHIVLRLQGQKETEELIKDHVAYTYGSIRERIQNKELKIQHMKELVRLKNPYLLKHFKPM